VKLSLVIPSAARNLLVGFAFLNATARRQRVPAQARPNLFGVD